MFVFKSIPTSDHEIMVPAGQVAVLLFQLFRLAKDLRRSAPNRSGDLGIDGRNMGFCMGIWNKHMGLSEDRVYSNEIAI